jgi:hypothetical protein
MIELQIFSNLLAVALAYEAVGVLVLGFAVSTTGDRDFTFRSISSWGMNPLILKAMIRQRFEARCGIVFLAFSIFLQILFVSAIGTSPDAIAVLWSVLGVSAFLVIAKSDWIECQPNEEITSRFRTHLPKRAETVETRE